MDNWFITALQVITAVLVLLVLAGGAWALIRGSFNQARVKDLRDDNNDLRQRLGDAESKIEAGELRETALNVKVAHQQTEIDLLTAMVTQRADLHGMEKAIIDLVAAMNGHHSGAVTHWTNMETAMTALLKKGGVQ